MSSRPSLRDSLDEAFIRIMIEELSHAEHAADPAFVDTHAPAGHHESMEDTSIPMVGDDEPTVGQDDNPSPPEPAVLVEDETAQPTVPSPVQSTRRWQLRVVQKDGRECLLPLEDKPIVLGRGRECDLVLKCDRISREHARITLEDRGPRVDDLGSRNGIQVNGTKVPAACLKHGDVVKIGSVNVYAEAMG